MIARGRRMMLFRSTFVLVLSISLFSCSSSDDGDDDGAVRPDAITSADSGPADSGTPDGQEDTGTRVDAGPDDSDSGASSEQACPSQDIIAVESTACAPDRALCSLDICDVDRCDASCVRFICTAGMWLGMERPADHDPACQGGDAGLGSD